MDEELVFIPKINENEYKIKEQQDLQILRARAKENQQLELELLATSGRDSRLIPVANAFNDIFNLFISAYEGLIDSNDELFFLSLNKVLSYIEQNYNDNLAMYAPDVWDVLTLDLGLRAGDNELLEDYLEKSIGSIYYFSKEKYKLDLNNDYLSEQDMETLTSIITRF